MTTKQEDRLKMYLTVRIFLRANPAILAALPNCSEFLTALDNAIFEIQTYSEQRQASAANATSSKNKLRDALSVTAVDAASKIYAYAKYTGNETLQGETRKTSSDFKSASELEIIDMAKVIYGHINDNLASLSSYGLTEATQAAFLSAITTFGDAIPQAKQEHLQQKNFTALLGEAFTRADAVIEDIDTVVEIVRLTKPAFYVEYQSARKISGASDSIMVKGKVTDSQSGEAVVEATMHFYLGDVAGTPVLKKQTAEKGGFMIKSIDEGVYNVVVSKIGYEPQTVKAIVTSDKLCELAVQLVQG